MNKISISYLTIFILILSSCTRTEDLYRVCIDGKYGFINAKGKMVIEPQYYYATDFEDELSLVIHDITLKKKPEFKPKNDMSEFEVLLEQLEYSVINDSIIYKYCFINKDNQIIIDNLTLKKENINNIYKEILDNIRLEKDIYISDMFFHEDVALCYDTISNSYGYINKTGEFIIQPQFKEATRFSEGLAAARLLSQQEDVSKNVDSYEQQNNMGYINTKGEFVIPPKYGNASMFSEGIAFTTIFNFQSSSVDVEDEDFSKYSLSTTSMLIDRKGNMIGEPYGMGVQIYPFHEGVACAQSFMIKHGYWFVNQNGENLFDGLVENITSFSNGYAGIYNDDNGRAIVDKNMNVKEEGFDDMHKFSEGKAAVQINGKWGFIDTQMKECIPYKYDEVSSFKNGLAKVKIYSGAIVIDAYINALGNIVWQHETPNTREGEYSAQHNRSTNRNSFTLYNCDRYSIEYPSKWGKAMHPSEVEEVYFGDTNRMIGFSIIVLPFDSSLDDFFRFQSDALTNSNQEIVSSEKILINGLPAYRQVSKNDIMSQKNKKITYTFYKNRTIYILSFGNSQIQLDKSTKLINQIVNSFRI